MAERVAGDNVTAAPVAGFQQPVIPPEAVTYTAPQELVVDANADEAVTTTVDDGVPRDVQIPAPLAIIVFLKFIFILQRLR